MANVLVRNLDDEVVKRLKERAEREGRSLQSLLKMVLEQGSYLPEVDMKTAIEMADRIREKLKGLKFPDTVELIRGDRDR